MFPQHCASVPVYVTKRVKETECQQCQRYYETEPTTKYVRQCNPIFDEKCSTEYIRHCKTNQRCLMIYQTVCNSQGYEQHCTNEVGERDSQGRGSAAIDQSPSRAGVVAREKTITLSMIYKGHLIRDISSF